MAIQKLTELGSTLLKGIDALQSVFLLALRLWLAKIFFMSGLTKFKSWESTLQLFEYEYNVPVIPFDIAAYLATAAELVIPVCLVVGLLTRLNAVALFALNYVAMISYPDISIAGEKDHIMWGIAILAIFLFGPGKAALDHFIWKKLTAQVA
ncbi:DoxX family protein [Litoribrevibacter albus]|uniref:Membrane protein n=1 Tax=Litoribrevibacter albus TaxID=1473156 RepID=A0AA37S7W1_9GAMM|nr:DoxX family protein [Litoribrevibacter albus]GLQ30023.1 membrane protein [Litoribrevibacter albus]